MVRVILTGGGTAGHVTPNLALIEAMEVLGWRIDYIGSETGIERQMIDREGIAYHPISTGKLRRYWTFKNCLAPFQVLLGMAQAFQCLRKIKPDIVFSKGGFVAFPVAFSAWLLRVPVVAHESDLTPGLANRLSFPFVKCLCVAFEGTKTVFRNFKKITVTGTPIRAFLFKGERTRGLSYCGFDGKKPVLLVVGGSLGAKFINEVVRASLPELLPCFHVIHLCGKGKLDANLKDQADYFQCEYANVEMADLLAASDLVVSRSGANSVYELLALAKPHVFIPLSKKVSRGDQIENARYFEKQGISLVLEERELTKVSLLQAIESIHACLPERKKQLQALKIDSATDRIMEILQGFLRKK
jgi:UDP-N-acetylglucosamine--N-acetylmuramyl-(pentapeptide) pyrophosphoryl-undecaprenol N-acetylglucosamine transferase